MDARTADARAGDARAGGARTTVVVVTWRGVDRIADCLAALAAQERPHRTIVVDNASTDGTSDVLAAHRPTTGAFEVRRLPVNAGYAGALAAVRPATEFTAWLNDDALPAPDWLTRMEDALDAHPRAAAAGAHLVTPDGATQSLGVRLTADGHGADAVTTPVFGFCGGAALLRTALVGDVPAEYFCYYEDTVTAWRMRLAGWDVVAVPGARVVHAHGASAGLGSVAFHLWNERNRLWTLLRCAPRRVAWSAVLRFAALTAVLPLRRDRPDAPNFRFGLRVRVLAQVLRRPPRPVGDAASRAAVWAAWAGA